MVITEKSCDRLVLWDRPIFLISITALLAVFCMFVAIARSTELDASVRLFVFALGTILFWVVWAKIPIQRFVFDRIDDQIRRTQWRIGRRTEGSMPISRVTSIRNMVDNLAESGPTFYISINYEADDGCTRSERLTESSSGKRHDETVDTINKWLAQTFH